MQDQQQERGEIENQTEVVGNVVAFRRPDAPSAHPAEPGFNDEERRGLRRLLEISGRVELALMKLDRLEVACPTAKREITLLLRGE